MEKVIPLQKGHDWENDIQVLGLGHSLAAVDSSTGDLLGVSIMIDRQVEIKLGPTKWSIFLFS